MKISMSVVIMFLISILMVEAVIAQESVESQIEAIQQASDEERVSLMNAFKLQIAAMNEQERTDAIAHLRGEMDAVEPMPTGTYEHMAAGSGERTQMQHDMQMNPMQPQNHMQPNAPDHLQQQPGTTMPGQGGRH